MVEYRTNAGRRTTSGRMEQILDPYWYVRGGGEILSDGALGMRSAWFLKPYTDTPALTGKNVTP